MANISLFMIGLKVNHTVQAVCLHGIGQLLFLCAFGRLVFISNYLSKYQQ